MKLLVDSSTLSFKVQLTNIEERLYGAEVNIYFDNLDYAVDERSFIQKIGTIGNKATWTSEPITRFYYYDYYTGNEEIEYFRGGLSYTLVCNAKPLDGSVYLLGQQKLEFDASDAGARPIISKFSISQTQIGEKRARINYKIRNAYDGEDNESFRTNVHAYVDGKKEVGLSPIGKKHEGSFVVAFDDFGVYDVYIVAQNISWTSKDDYLLYSEPSETITVSIRETATIEDCKIDYDVIDIKNFVSDDGRVEAYVKNYIDITKEAWTKFCAAINILRTQSGLTEVDFISVSKNDPLTAEIWNQAMRAFEEVADANGGYFSLDKFLATRGTGITQELIDEVNSEIADVITELMTL